jgi:hypothetical protein
LAPRRARGKPAGAASAVAGGDAINARIDGLTVDKGGVVAIGKSISISLKPSKEELRPIVEELLSMAPQKTQGDKVKLLVGRTASATGELKALQQLMLATAAEACFKNLKKATWKPRIDDISQRYRKRILEAMVFLDEAERVAPFDVELLLRGSEVLTYARTCSDKATRGTLDDRALIAATRAKDLIGYPETGLQKNQLARAHYWLGMTARFQDQKAYYLERAKELFLESGDRDGASRCFDPYEDRKKHSRGQ